MVWGEQRGAWVVLGGASLKVAPPIEFNFSFHESLPGRVPMGGVWYAYLVCFPHCSEKRRERALRWATYALEREGVTT